ncbi:hypothetical protein C7S16_5691 [Burkholderia thailandensis]|uniref:Uncharacterized protein n=1 Tax=Burkholderia thailandensis TaxID=57975 RepID=A0AAW9CW13_BURTH|nr:hypothetical protein [Burkholderia thailandensis]MDW9251964.1 hypothetical protein [Burkholderia thailandensis]
MKRRLAASFAFASSGASASRRDWPNGRVRNVRRLGGQ